jgi:branched-chain amino acid transport system permease protein
VLVSISQAAVNGLLLAALYAIVALGLTLIFGVLDVVNFSHGQLVTVGAYLTYELVHRGVSFWLAVPVTAIALAAVGAVMEATTFRPVRSVPINGLIVSIGWIAIFDNVFSVVWGPNQYNMDSPLAGALRLGDFTLPKGQLLVLVVGLLVMVALTLVLSRTRLGKDLRATAQNREAAILMGISVGRVDATAFALGAGFAALAGGLVASLLPVDPRLGDSYMVYAFIALIVGGAGSAVGAVAGSVVVGLSVSMAQTFGTTAVANVAPFVVLILVLLVRPNGLISTRYEASL